MEKIEPEKFITLQNYQVQHLPVDSTENSIRQWGENPQNVHNHNKSFLNRKGSDFAGTGPIEKNPNIERHIVDFDLSRDFLMLGPFPSSQYLVNHDLLEYYYADNLELWDYLFDLVGGDVKVDNIKNELIKRNISITDVYAYVQRNSFIEESPNKNLFNIILNDRLVEIFQTNSKIHTILTFSGQLKDLIEKKKESNTTVGLYWVLEKLVGLKNLEISGEFGGGGLFYPFNRTGIKQAVLQQNGGITWWVKKGVKKIRINSLPTPSHRNNQSIPSQSFCKKWLDYKADAKGISRRKKDQKAREYVDLNPEIFETKYTKQYRREVYRKALDDRLVEIYESTPYKNARLSQ